MRVVSQGLRAIAGVLLWAAVCAAVLPTEDAYEDLETDIRVTHAAEFADAVAGNEDQVIADAYNVTASPAFWVWRTTVARKELLFSTSSDDTTFTFKGNGFITRAAGELTAWANLFDIQTDMTNPSLLLVRDAFDDIFSGPGNAAANLTHLTTVSRRLARRGERLFADGTGTPAVPATMVFEGMITARDVAHALRDVPLQ